MFLWITYYCVLKETMFVFAYICVVFGQRELYYFSEPIKYGLENYVLLQIA